MEENKYKYLVNVSCFLEVTELSVDTGRCYGDPINAYVEFPEAHEAERETLADMFDNDDTLFIIPGYVGLFDLKSVCRIEDAPYWIRLKCIGNSIKDAVGLKEITSWEEYDELHAKITTERNDDGSVTFSVPTLQGFRIKEDAVPVFVSHGDDPGERGEQGGVDDILVLTDKVDVLRVGPFRHYSKEIELKCNDKFGSFVEYWQSLPVPRKILFRMEKDSQDVYRIESLRYECGRGFITAQFIGNMCNFKRVDAMFAQNTWIDTMANMCSRLEKSNSGHKKEHSELREELLKRYTTRPTPLEDLGDTLAMSANIKPKLDVMDSASTTRRINSVKLNKVTRL